MINAAAYCRYSSDNQREESIDAQIRAIKEYAARNDFNIIKVYTDEARSATTDNRPGFLEMVKDSELELFENVIVHKLDRFARDRYDSAFYKRKLRKNGVRVLSVLETLDDSPESIILESVLEGMAEYYSANLSREVMKGNFETAMQCKHLGGIPPYGFTVKEDKTYGINEQEAPIVRLIFNMVSNGHSYREVISYLDSKGYKTRAGRSFARNTISTMLRNEKYCGVYVYNTIGQKEKGTRKTYKKSAKDIVRIEGGMPKIVSVELWKEINDLMDIRSKDYAERVRRNSIETYLLSGIIKCGKCGGAMVGNRKYAGRNKTLYVTYECNTRKRDKTCNAKSINKDFVEGEVLKYLQNVLLTEDSVNRMVDTALEDLKKVNTTIPADIQRMNRAMIEVNKKINSIINAIENGMFHSSMKDRMDFLESEKNDLVVRIAEAENQLKMVKLPTKKVVKALLMEHVDIKNKSLNHQRKVIQTFIKKATIYEDRLEISSIVDTATGGEPIRAVSTISIGDYRHSYYTNPINSIS